MLKQTKWMIAEALKLAPHAEVRKRWQRRAELVAEFEGRSAADQKAHRVAMVRCIAEWRREAEVLGVAFDGE